MARRETSKQSGQSAQASSTASDVFDVRKVRRFIQLMEEHDLAEIDLRQADQRIRLRRGPETVTMAASPVAMPTGPMPTAGGEPPGGAAASSADDDTNALLIRSPMVGTYYAAPNPEAPPFVKVGDPVSPETTVCVIEAMKVFNEIPAECSGKIVAVLIENGEAVEFGQALFRVEPQGVSR